MAELISIPLKPRPEDWQRLSTQLNNRLNESTSAAFFVWNRGCVTVPTSTTIANAEEIVFPSPFTGNGTMIVTIFDAEGGVHVALNGIDLGPQTGPSSTEQRYEIPVTNLTEGEDALNSFKIWSTTSDTAELRKIEVYRNFVGDQTVEDFNENRTYIKFDGSVDGSRLEVADDDAWDFEAAEAGTWEWRAYVDTIGSIQAMITKNLAGTGAGWGSRVLANGDFEVWLNDGSTKQVLHQTKVIAAAWNHFAFTRTSSGVVTSYLNGVTSDTSQTANNTMANSLALQFGSRLDTQQELTGRMRDVRRWSDVRTQEEIVTNINADLVGDETGLIGFWPTREGVAKSTEQLGSTSGGDATFITAGPSWSGAVGRGAADEVATDHDLDVTLTPTSATYVTILTIAIPNGTDEDVEIVISTKNAFFTNADANVIFRVQRDEGTPATVFERDWTIVGDNGAGANTKAYILMDTGAVGGSTITYTLDYKLVGTSDSINDRVREIYFRVRQIKK